jgi:hypothetical protein
VLLIDAANVVGSTPDGWWRDRPGAARRLVASLRAVAWDEPVVVVLEGQARRGVAEGVADGVEVVHAPAEGDDELAARCGDGVTLVTADRGLRRRAEDRGARVRGPRWLLDGP